MVDYNRAAQTADRLIKKYGKPGKIRRAGVDHPAAMAVLDYQTKEIDGTHVKVGDRKIYVSALAGVGVQQGDVLVDSLGVPCSVITRAALAPAGIAIYYRAQCRGTR